MMRARLSLAAGKPIITEDVSSSRVWFLPYHGNSITVAGATETLPDAGLSVDITALPSNSIYDVFLAKRNGVTVLGTAPMGFTSAPSNSLVMATGTPQGGLTFNGGLAASFDGNAAQGYAASSRSAGGIAGYSASSAIGLHLPSAQTVKRVEAWSPSDNTFIGNNAACAWQIRAGASVDTAAIVASGVAPSAFPSTIAVDIQNGPSASDWWLVLCGNGINAVYCAELKLYVAGPSQPASNNGISLVGGFPVNDGSVDIACDAGAFTAPAGQAIFMGSVSIGSTAGVARIDTTYKPDVRCDLWNYFNAEPILLQAGDNRPMVNGLRVYTPLDSPGSYTFGIEGRQDIKIAILSGLKRRSARPEWQGAYFQNGSSGVSAIWTAIGVDSTSVPTGTWAMQNFDNIGTAQGLAGANASCLIQPFEGVKVIRPLEGKRGDVKGFWQETNQALSVAWEY